MSNLVIGDTSQLSYYFPANYERISSRQIDFDIYKYSHYDRIFITFAEQRTYLENNYFDFYDVNVKYTIKVIDFFKERCNKIIVYSTSELWNNYVGGVSIDKPFNYNYSHYIETKKILTDTLLSTDKYSNVIILFPFNFNSIYRRGDFLFGKIFYSVINKKPIEIGNTYFYRDIIHPKYVVKCSINITEHEIIGSGRLVFINDFIREIYKNMNLNYHDYVIESSNNNLSNKRNIYYLDSVEQKYSNLLIDTINDIKQL